MLSACKKYRTFSTDYSQSLFKSLTMSFSRLTSVIRSALMIIAASASLAASAGWVVQTPASSVQFVTTKAGLAGVGGISEVQKFTQFSGSLSNAGRLDFNVTLASVQTGIEIRDERLKTMLFKITDTPQATFSADIKPSFIDALAVGQSSDLNVEGRFTLGGQTKPMIAALRVTRLSATQLQVVTREPLIVNANDHGMKTGVEALRDIMGLNFLASVAPISLHLILTAH
jgi:polyisoprenoid-binding protein YceI